MLGYGRLVAGTICVALAWTAVGCNKHEDLKVFLRAHEHEVSASEYRVQPPDALLVSAPGCPEVDGDMQVVRVDGCIDLRLLGEVRVVGLTPSEVSAKLEKLLRKYYVDPKVHVRVGGYNSKKYYVLGEVASPGPRPYTGRDTLMDALADSPPSFLAWRSNIKVIRPSEAEGERHTITVDLDKMILLGDTRMNMLLQEGDIVYVPPTPLAWVGLRIRELLWPVEPVMNAYTAPAGVIDAHDTYRYHDERRNYYERYDDDDEKAWRKILLR